MKTVLTISAGVLLALSCAATSDARLHANRETQSEPSNYNPDQDNSCLDCGTATGLAHTLPSYEYESNWLNWLPITPLQAQAVSAKGLQERLSDPTLAGGDMEQSPHQAAVLSGPIQRAQRPLPSYESKGYFITPLELVVFGPNEVKERVTDPGGSMQGG